MKKRVQGIVAVVVMVLALAGNVLAQTGFESEEQLGAWLSHYYAQPEPERLAAAVRYFSESSLYGKSSTMPTVAFCSALFRKDAGLMTRVFEDIEAGGSENARIVLLNALSLSHTEQGRRLIERARDSWPGERIQGIIARQLAQPHPDLYTAPVKSPQILDMLWGAFLATGDAEPVKRIISVIRLREEGHGQEILVGGAAAWSLASNAKQHARVLEICKAELAGARGVTRDMLEKIIADAESE